MKTDFIYSDIGKRLALLGAMALCLGAIKLVIAINGYPMLETYAPDWGDTGLLRLLLSALAASLLVAALQPSFDRLGEEADLSPRAFASLSGVFLFVVLAMSASVAFWPERIDGFVSEGKPVSLATELAFFAAVIVLAMCTWRAGPWRVLPVFGLSARVVAGLMTAVVLLILLEEISYGQHWFGFGTPDLFATNEQKETNLHNFYTHRFELAFYSGAIVAFVLLPFAWPAEPPTWMKPLTLFVPSRSFAVAVLPLCGMWYYTWNFVFFQLWFFCGVMIAYSFWRGHPQRLVRLGAFIMGSVFVVAQVHLLAAGGRLGHARELTEINEFMIALAVLAYAVVLLGRMGRLQDKRTD